MKSYIVEVGPAVLHELDAIFDYIAVDSPSNAEQVMQRIDETIMSL